MVESQIFVHSATGSGNKNWINPQGDTAFKSSVDPLPVVQDDEIKSLVETSTVVDESIETDAEESLGLVELFDELNISHGLMLLT